MLPHISTTTFAEGIVLLAAIYYTVVLAIYYRKEIRKYLHKRTERKPNDQENKGFFSIKDKG